jgi:hypothetical protein
MPDPRTHAARLGIAIELADLGSWGDAKLISEYDPAGPTIRINTRELPHGSSCAVREHIDRAVAHELFHHAEAGGAQPRVASRVEREIRAAAYDPERAS